MTTDEADRQAGWTLWTLTVALLAGLAVASTAGAASPEGLDPFSSTTASDGIGCHWDIEVPVGGEPDGEVRCWEVCIEEWVDEIHHWPEACNRM